MSFTYLAGRGAGKARGAIFAGHFTKGQKTGNGKGTFRGDGFYAYEAEGRETDVKKSFYWTKTTGFKVVEAAGEQLCDSSGAKATVENTEQEGNENEKELDADAPLEEEGSNHEAEHWDEPIAAENTPITTEKSKELQN